MWLWKPEYNINPIAGCAKGYKHSLEFKKNFFSTLATGWKHTYEVRGLMSKNRKGINNSFYKKRIVLKL